MFPVSAARPHHVTMCAGNVLRMSHTPLAAANTSVMKRAWNNVPLRLISGDCPKGFRSYHASYLAQTLCKRPYHQLSRAVDPVRSIQASVRSACARRVSGSSYRRDSDGIDKLEKLRETNPELYERYKEKLKVADLSTFEPKISEPDIIDELLAPRLKDAAQKSAAAKAQDPTGKLMADNDSTIKPLGSILKLEKINDLGIDEIEILWKEYHKETDSVGAVIPSHVYEQLRSRAMQYPFFAFPIPRGEGFEFFFGQWIGHQFAFTSMIEYQMHQENARPYLLLNHYVELVDSKDIVLMSGDLDENMNILEATLIANQVQLFYLGKESSFQLVKDFNTRADEFDYNDILSAIDSMGQAQPL